MRMGVTKERLIDLQRTVDALQGRMQDMQCELRQATQGSLAERWWRNLLRNRQGTYMSACCNRRVRPNTKMVNYAGTRNEQ